VSTSSQYLRNFAFIASTIREREELEDFLYLPSHDKSFEKNIEKDEIEKKINVKMNQIKKKDNSPWICNKDNEVTHV
jgi:hypothetical protein